MCDCGIKLFITDVHGGNDVISLTPNGTLNGQTFFQGTYSGFTSGLISVYWSGGNQWVIEDDIYPDGNTVATLVQDPVMDCPTGSDFVVYFSDWITINSFGVKCASNCDCGIIVNLTYGDDSYSAVFDATGTTVNGETQYSGVFAFIGTVFINWNLAALQYEMLSGLTVIATFNDNNLNCPSGEWNEVEFGYTNVFSQGVSCGGDCGHEDRIKNTYKSVKLPSLFIEENRGLKSCCCEQLVLANGSTKSWENDILSAWIKLADVTDTVSFILKKEGSVANYSPAIQTFPKEPFARYTTIQWSDVLTSDGAGCYELIVSFNIAGIVANFTWGKYKLLPFTTKNALKTARIRAIFNSKQEADGIDFTGSNVESTFRFNGFIGNRQPNTQIDNIIYSNREMKRVIRENLNQYDLITDPSEECYIKPLVDTYLLSENQLFISDYNAHNHSYRYQDTPVIVESSPEITYFDWSRMASLKCVVSDKFKNQRTFY
jgi:hypothetical protein